MFDDGVLLYLSGGSFDSPPEELCIELLGVVGDALFQHQDERGVLFLLDVADPEDVDTYEEVVVAVGDRGRWFAPSQFRVDAAEAQSMLDHAMGRPGDVLGAMGIAGAGKKPKG